MVWQNILSQRLKVVLLFSLLISVLALPTAANAMVVGCRSDPAVTLSDGTILDVNAAIDTLPQNISRVHYTIHGPKGVSMVLGVGTPGVLFHEDFAYVADADPGQYVTVTHVDTVGTPVDVTSTTTLLKATLLKTKVVLTSHPINGESGQDLIQVVTP